MDVKRIEHKTEKQINYETKKRGNREPERKKNIDSTAVLIFSGCREEYRTSESSDSRDEQKKKI